MAFFTLVQGSVFVTSATNLPSSTPVQILEKGAQGPKGAPGVVPFVANPVALRTSPVITALSTGMLVFVVSRNLEYMLMSTYGPADDGADVILSSDGVRKFVSIPTIPLQPGGTLGYVMTASGAGANPVWAKPSPDGSITDVATPADLGTDPPAADLSNGMLAYVISRALHYKYDALSATAPDGTDIIAANGGVGRWFSTPLVPLQPGTSGQVLTSAGVGANPTWTAPSSSPTGAAGGDLSGTYPNPSVKSITGNAGTLAIASTGALVQWPTATTPILQIAPIGGGGTTPITIKGQTTVGAGGGQIVLQPGGGTPTGNVSINHPTLGGLIRYDTSVGRWNYTTAATTPGTGQDQSVTGAGVTRIERSQAAFAGSAAAGGNIDFAIGARDGAGGLSAFRVGRETTATSTYFASFDVMPGATQNADLNLNKEGINGNYLLGFTTASSGTFGGNIQLTAQNGANGAGGSIVFTTGTGSSGDGGDITGIASNSTGALTTGGDVRFTAGDTNAAGGRGGSIFLTSGNNTGGGGVGGDIILAAGTSTAAAAPDILLKAGSGTSAGYVAVANSAGTKKWFYDSTSDSVKANVPVGGDQTAAASSYRFQYLDINLGGGTALTLSAAQAAVPCIQFTNAGGAYTITFPDDMGAVRWIMNRAGFTMTARTVTNAGSAPATLANTNMSAFVVYNSTTVPLGATIQRVV